MDNRSYNNNNNRGDRGDKQFEEKVVQINRVSKKTKGGNKVRFAALVVVGDRKGKVGIGLGKSADVSSAIMKAVTYAKKRMILVPIVKGTIANDIFVKEGAAQVLLMPAPEGSGIIAGGAVRSVVEAAGIHSISSKILGTSNKASNVYAAFAALKKLSER
jgi:small subunit ribosomal protein S5